MTTFNSITVAWDRVPCEDRNVEINGYRQQVTLTSDPDVTTFNSSMGVEDNDRVITIPRLIPRSNYTIGLHAFRFSLTDPNPMVYIGPPAVTTAVTAVPSGTPLSPSSPIQCVLLCRTWFPAGWDCVLQQQCGGPQ